MNKKKKLTVQILAIVLSVLMVLSIAFYTVFMIVDSIKAKKEAEKKEQEKTEAAELVPATVYYVAWSAPYGKKSPLKKGGFLFIIYWILA